MILDTTVLVDLQKELRREQPAAEGHLRRTRSSMDAPRVDPGKAEDFDPEQRTIDVFKENLKS